jgi:hypothetical protein
MKYKLYKEKRISNGKRLCYLHTWMNRRCIDCGRFIRNISHGKRCFNCFIKYLKKYQKNYRKNNLEKERNRVKKWRNENRKYFRNQQTLYFREYRRNKKCVLFS